MKKNYLVTGGSGFIGRSVVLSLLKKGELVRVLDNESRGSFDKFGKLSEKIEFIKGDIRDIRLVEDACRGISTVIHLAYINGTQTFYEKPDLVLDVAVKGMMNILDVSIKNKVQEFFFASSSEVYNEPSLIPTPESTPLIVPDPYNPRYSYSGGKIIGELLAINNGNKFKKMVIFRPHNVYGPAMGFEHVIPQFILGINKLKKHKKTKFKIQGNGDQSRSFIYIDDFTEAFMLLLDKAKTHQTYNIGRQDEILIKDLVKLCSNAIEYEVELVPGEIAAGSPQRRCPEVTKITKLGFSPKVSLKDGVKKTAQWYLKNPS